MLYNVIVNGRLIRRLITIRTTRGNRALQCDGQRKTYKKANNSLLTSEALIRLTITLTTEDI